MYADNGSEAGSSGEDDNDFAQINPDPVNDSGDSVPDDDFFDAGNDSVAHQEEQEAAGEQEACDQQPHPHPNMTTNNGPAPGGSRTVPPRVEFEDIDNADPPEVLSKLANIKVPWDPDVEYFLSDLEMQMEIYQVGSQWLKRDLCQ